MDPAGKNSSFLLVLLSPSNTACIAGRIVFARVRVLAAKQAPKTQGNSKASPLHSPNSFPLLATQAILPTRCLWFSKHLCP